jgi:hypothetical protein
MRGKIAAIFLLGPAVCLSAARADSPVNYSRDIKPLLSDRCYTCHGPDEGKRKAKLRLDLRVEAIKKVIKPGKAAESELFARISSKQPEEVMPPPASKKAPLTPQQIDLLRRWIDEGAKFDMHWAYVKPVRAPLPAIEDKTWPRNGIDHFVMTKLQAAKLRPSPEADRITLIRRLSLDLTGLPPTPAEVNAFVHDQRPDAYETLVDRLLSSAHYGERMAMYWLDLVRFGDTGGYHSDNHRDVWLYRDYVIDAFNSNKRFDQFTIEQLAGDLLSEKGDRTPKITGPVPFFGQPNRTREQLIASGYNKLLMTTEEGGAQPKEYTAKYAADRVRNTSVVWMAGTMGCAECHNHKYDPYSTKDFYSFEAFFADIDEISVGRQKQTPLPTPEQAQELRKLEEQVAAAQAALDKQAANLGSAEMAKWEESLTLPQVRGLPPEIKAILLAEPKTRNDQQKADLAKFYRGVAPQLAAERKQLDEAQKRKKGFEGTIPTSLVSVAVAPRTIRILRRGNWLDDSGEIVQPAIPAFLGSLDTKGQRPTRLDLARWLVSPDNPAAARVFVNRLWKLMFGQGLVKTVDDFGAQGTPPSHPELLDWLALEFMASRGASAPEWDVKHMVKLMAMSATYRQSSQASKEQRERDPTNLLLSRQNGFRLDAEFVRDNALAIAGILSPKVGGPSAKPYQPEGYWQYLNFPVREYHPDHGEAQHRRGMYTYWQRTLPHPSLIAFDAPSREECTAERPRSSTPLQALVLLNDPTYVEAARAFAERVIKQGGPTTSARLNHAYHLALSREIQPSEAKVLTELYEKHLAEYRADAAAAQKLLSTGERPVPKDMNLAELAAWTSVTRTILNLHEAITRN